MEPTGGKTGDINTVLRQKAGVLDFVLTKVFLLLAPRDLRNVLLVCGLWREVGEAPGLWAGLVLRVTRENLAKMTQVLGCRRLGAVRKITVRAVSEQLLEAVAGHEGLKVIDVAGTLMGRADLRCVGAGLLARLVKGLEEVDISYTRRTRRQAHAIVLTLGNVDTKFKKIELTGTEKVLSLLEPNQIARAVTKVEHVVICDTGMNDNRQQPLWQLSAMLAARLKQRSEVR